MAAASAVAILPFTAFAQDANGTGKSEKIPMKWAKIADSAPQDTLHVVLTGDILLDRGVRRVIERHGPDAIFSPSVDSLLRRADVAVGNLECPATKINAPSMKRFVFRADPEWLTTLRNHGFTHLNLANNHSVDQGRTGLADTRKNVLLAGITPIGAGENMAEASQPVLLAATPRPVYMLASLRLSLENYVYLTDRTCVSQEPIDTLAARIARLRAEQPAAYIIVSLHWGAEHTLSPVPIQRIEARKLINAGADCLVCHHSHTLQTIEEYHGKKIYYSIGNFVFDQSADINTRACAVQIDVFGDGANVTTLPVRIKNCVPEIVSSR